MKTKLIVAALALSAPLAASADVNYNYFDIDYLHATLDVPTSPSGNGWGINGSYGFNDNWNGIFQYQSASIDSSLIPSTDVKQYRIGAGWHTDISSAVDGLTEVTYDHFSAPGTSNGGYGLKFGLRGMVSDDVELNGHVRYTSVDEVNSSDTLIGVGMVYSFTDSAGVTLGYENGDYKAWNVGVRFKF